MAKVKREALKRLTDEDLIAMSNSDLARVCGVSGAWVTEERRRRGLRPNKNLYLEKMILEMYEGGVSVCDMDQEVSAMFGKSRRTVQRLRCKLGIRGLRGCAEGTGSKLSESARKFMMDNLGRMPDAEIGRVVGLSRERVRQIRSRHGVPKYMRGGKSKKVSATP